MRPRPTYALPSYPSAAPGAHLHLLQRARRAHHLPDARCYPGLAGAIAGGDLSARGLRKAPRLHLREGVGADIILRLTVTSAGEYRAHDRGGEEQQMSR